MKTWCVRGAALAVALVLAVPAARAQEPQIGHMVYFKLKDASPEAKQKLVEACQKYLSGHPGTVYFSAGVLADELNREVNVRDWDVALHLVFKDKAAHDKYQDAKRHLQFIEENRDNWENVRVFDSLIKVTGKKEKAKEGKAKAPKKKA